MYPFEYQPWRPMQLVNEHDTMIYMDCNHQGKEVVRVTTIAIWRMIRNAK